MKALLALVYLMLGGGALWAQYDPPALDKWDSKSPDGLYRAKSRIISSSSNPDRTDWNFSRLIITRQPHNSEKETYVSYDLNRLIAHAEWSPDSKFLVMTTVSAGGHSPWHFNSYVYCVEDKSLRYMDDAVGLVVRAQFEFEGPHTVSIKTAGPNIDFESPQTITVDLSKNVSRMKKEDGKKEGNVQE